MRSWLGLQGVSSVTKNPTNTTWHYDGIREGAIERRRNEPNDILTKGHHLLASAGSTAQEPGSFQA